MNQELFLFLFFFYFLQIPAVLAMLMSFIINAGSQQIFCLRPLKLTKPFLRAQDVSGKVELKENMQREKSPAAQSLCEGAAALIIRETSSVLGI